MVLLGLTTSITSLNLVGESDNFHSHSNWWFSMRISHAYCELHNYGFSYDTLVKQF